MKIGIIDDGLDAAHRSSIRPASSTRPGFRRASSVHDAQGDRPADVRTGAPRLEVRECAVRPRELVPRDPRRRASPRETTTRTPARTLISGVAPNAYIGNYKALTIPTPGFGLDGNSAEIAAAIEAAVSDGMNVINLSLGEPEVNPSRDLVVAAIDAAAAAGVVPVVAAGNDFDQFGYGSIDSPANARGAITVAASTISRQIASFSSAGPTPVSLQQKPDVTAPGESILSSLPPSEGTWGQLSGTSMAAPHVAGAAALLKERHPAWTVEQVKSALVQTAAPVLSSNGQEVLASREGGGFVDLARADVPLLFAEPTSVSFGELRTGATVAATVSLADAGGGAGEWTATRGTATRRRDGHRHGPGHGAGHAEPDGDRRAGRRRQHRVRRSSPAAPTCGGSPTGSPFRPLCSGSRRRRR